MAVALTASQVEDDRFLPSAHVSMESKLLRGLSRFGFDPCAKLQWPKAEQAVAKPPTLRRCTGSEPFLLELAGPGDEAFGNLYSIMEEIGKGSFGTVYRCRDLDDEAPLDGPLCVKVVPLAGRHATRVAKLCEDEKRELLCRSLDMDHPNLVRHHRFVSTSDNLYIVMEQCRGPDLLDHVTSCGGSLSVEVVRSLATQMLGALAMVHSLGIMHRDIKAENFRFHDEAACTLKLLDFGFAKMAGSERKQHSVTGTLLYAAPEVVGKGVYDKSCDLWSVGVVLFLLLSGQMPFETSNVMILRAMHRDPVLTGDSLFRGDSWKKVPRVAREVVRGLLTVEPDQRLTCDNAASHAWFTDEAAHEDFGGLTHARNFSRDSLSTMEMKRTFFVWDLAGAMGDDEPEEEPDF